MLYLKLFSRRCRTTDKTRCINIVWLLYKFSQIGRYPRNAFCTIVPYISNNHFQIATFTNELHIFFFFYLF